ncbi:MAG: S-adenosylmethionine:tRNA ribosyltransferase-isomerase [Chthoniobacterales bacterium]
MQASPLNARARQIEAIGPVNSEEFKFGLPDELCAKEPPERRGIARDQVRLMAIDRSTRTIIHARFDQLAGFLREGDLLVFNSSRTLPAALSGRVRAASQDIEARLAERLPDGSWLALLLWQQGDPVGGDFSAGMTINFGEGLTGRLLERDNPIPRLWRLRFSESGTRLFDLIYRLGQPIRYRYLSAPWHLDYYQTVYATEPGSAEMPSAGRPFTWQLLFALRRAGVGTAYVTLHTGLSSYMDEELDSQHLASEEEYIIPQSAALRINRARERGGRIVAVGTTVVRALESIAAVTRGDVQAYHGYTRLQITADHRLRIVDGLLTGLHEPQASHLDLLCAFLPPDAIRTAYRDAISRNYLWHEFGDLNLIL